MVIVSFYRCSRRYVLQNYELGEKKGRAIYAVSSQDGRLLGYEVHKLRYKKMPFSETYGWALASTEEFGRKGFYYMRNEKKRALKKYDEIKIKPKIFKTEMTWLMSLKSDKTP